MKKIFKYHRNCQNIVKIIWKYTLKNTKIVIVIKVVQMLLKIAQKHHKTVKIVWKRVRNFENFENCIKIPTWLKMCQKLI